MNEWIKCSEQLPEKNSDYLVFDGCDIFTAHRSALTSWMGSCNCYEGSFVEGVTHWMPLPTPPEK